MVPIILIADGLFIATLTAAGLMTKKRLLLILAALTGLLCMGFLLLNILVNTPLWTM